jgi:hypothetical protein
LTDSHFEWNIPLTFFTRIDCWNLLLIWRIDSLFYIYIIIGLFVNIVCEWTIVHCLLKRKQKRIKFLRYHLLKAWRRFHLCSLTSIYFFVVVIYIVNVNQRKSLRIVGLNYSLEYIKKKERERKKEGILPLLSFLHRWTQLFLRHTSHQVKNKTFNLIFSLKFDPLSFVSYYNQNEKRGGDLLVESKKKEERM